MGCLCGSQPKHEGLRKSVSIAFYRLVEAPRFDPVQCGQVCIKHYLLSSNDMDEAFHRTGCGEFSGRFGCASHADDVLASSLTVKGRAFCAISVNRLRSKLREPIRRHMSTR